MSRKGLVRRRKSPNIATWIPVSRQHIANHIGDDLTACIYDTFGITAAYVWVETKKGTRNNEQPTNQQPTIFT